MGEERSIGSLISANDSRRFLLSARVWFSSPRLARQRAKIWTPKKGDETDTAALTLSTALRSRILVEEGRKEGREGNSWKTGANNETNFHPRVCAKRMYILSLPSCEIRNQRRRSSTGREVTMGRQWFFQMKRIALNGVVQTWFTTQPRALLCFFTRLSFPTHFFVLHTYQS